jgi:hypothetical protein
MRRVRKLASSQQGIRDRIRDQTGMTVKEISPICEERYYGARIENSIRHETNLPRRREESEAPSTGDQTSDHQDRGIAYTSWIGRSSQCAILCS